MAEFSNLNVIKDWSNVDGQYQEWFHMYANACAMHQIFTRSTRSFSEFRKKMEAAKSRIKVLKIKQIDTKSMADMTTNSKR